MIRKVVDLHPGTNLSEIARFNAELVPEKRLSNLDFLRWKYLKQKPDGSAITEHYGVLSETGGLAGQISVQPMEARIGGLWQKCCYWGDWYSSPSHRGTGLLLLNYIIEQKGSLLAVSASEQAMRIYERKNLVQKTLDHRFTYTPRPIKSFLRTIGTPRAAAKIFLRWRKSSRTITRKVYLDAEYEFSGDQALDPDLLSGWESDIPSDTIFVRREEWLFSWLLNEFPFPEFRLVVLIRNCKQIGYVLLHLRKQTNNLTVGKIVDLFAQGWNRNHLAALFNEGAIVLTRLGVDIIDYHATHPLFISLAQDHGFSLIGTQPMLAYGPVAEALDSGRYLIHMTYYDQDESYY